MVYGSDVCVYIYFAYCDDDEYDDNSRYKAYTYK